MQKYKYTQKYIDAKRMVLYIALKWFVIIAIAILAGVVLLGLNIVQQEKNIKYNKTNYPDGYAIENISINESELAGLNNFWADLCQMRKLQEYNKNSIYMHIDAENVAKRVLTFYVWSNVGADSQAALNEVYNQLLEDDVYIQIAKKLSYSEADMTYIRELIGYNMENTQQLQINIVAQTSEQTKIIGDCIEAFFEKKIQVAFDKKADYSYTEKDDAIRDAQQASYDNESNYANLATTERQALTPAQKKYWNQFAKMYNKGQNIEMGTPLEKKRPVENKLHFKEPVLSSVKNTLVVFVGEILILILAFCFSPYIWSGKNVADSFGIEILGSVKPAEKRKRIEYKFNKWVWKIFDLLNKENAKYITFKISSKTKQSDEVIAISNTYCDAKILDLDIRTYTPDEFIEACNKNADIKEAKILLIEQIGKIKYKKLDETLCLLSGYADDIIGYISVE